MDALRPHGRQRTAHSEWHWPAFMQPHVLIDSVECGTGTAAPCSTAPTSGTGTGPKDELFDYSDEVPGEVLYMDFRQWKKTSAVPCDFGYVDHPQRFSISPSGITAEPSRRSPGADLLGLDERAAVHHERGAGHEARRR